MREAERVGMGLGPESTAASFKADPQRAAWLALPKRLFLALLVFDTLFVAVYFAWIALGWNSSKLFELFNLDIEANLPSWYAGVQLFVIAIGYLVLGSRLVPDRRKTAVLRPLWLLMGVGYTLLSADEVAGFHERMGSALYRMKVFNIRFTDQWMVLYLLIAAGLALVFGKQLLRAWREWRFEVLLFALGFVVLASGGFLLEVAQIYRKWQGLGRLFEIGIEEWLEMLGATIMVLPAYRILSYAMTADDESEEGTGRTK